VYVHGKDSIPLLAGDVKESGWRRDAGVDDQSFDRRHRSVERRQRGLHRPLVGHIAAKAYRLRLLPLGDLISGLPRARLVKIENDDLPAGRGHGMPGHAPDDALRAAAGEAPGALALLGQRPGPDWTRVCVAV
jgi:hypothetical protein